MGNVDKENWYFDLGINQIELSLGQEDSLEKEMVTHFSILAWEIPWTEESGRL